VAECQSSQNVQNHETSNKRQEWRVQAQGLEQPYTRAWLWCPATLRNTQRPAWHTLTRGLDSIMNHDCVVVGASFAGLACATALADSGAHVTVIERKASAGAKLHTTGILVRDVVDQVPLLDGLPAALVRRIDGVRLYAPNMRHVDLDAPGYYFLATETPGLMDWLADKAQHAGARMRWNTLFSGALRESAGFDLGGDIGSTRYLVGADGPRSSVARALELGQCTKFLEGIEHEFAGFHIVESGRLHCFIDKRCMPGYIGWVVQGVGVTQVGLARRQRHVGQGGDHADSLKRAMAAFLEKIAPVFDFRGRAPISVRAGLIPCGGVVKPAAARRVLLVGDAAGMVSPVTAGGIHTALQHGLLTGHAIADFLSGRGPDPVEHLAQTYPTFRLKRLLRFLFDHFQTDWAFNLLLATKPMREAASMVYFHRRGVVDR
jgi:digeranylgeranylglycerophospholipid reductase